MKTWVRHSLNVGALTAGALLVTGGAAHADDTMVSADNVGVGNGTQLALPIQAPINLCGNAVAVGGSAAAECEGGATALDTEWTYGHYQKESGTTMVSADNTGLLNGTQVYAPIQAPINVCGNAIGILGTAGAGCEGGATAIREEGSKGHKKHHKKHKGDDSETQLISTGNTGLLNGTQVYAPIQLPIDACGNAIGILGTAGAGCEGGAAAIDED